MRLIHGDALEQLEVLPPVKAIFLDPPDNLSLEYDGYKDRMKQTDYYRWVECLLSRAVLKSQVIWLSYYHAWDLEIKHIVRQLLHHRHPSWVAKQFLWCFTFSQYTERDCSVAHRPILRLARPDFTPLVDNIRVPSDRMLLGDPRACGERVPSTTWEFSRVVGNAKERRPWHPTQHPELLVRRMMLSSCTEGDTWLDCFVGSGTSFRVGRALPHITTIGVEQSKFYCDKLRSEHGELV